MTSSRPMKLDNRLNSTIVDVKSKFDVEYRRFYLDKLDSPKFETFEDMLTELHRLHKIPFVITYTDPIHGDQLPINNDDNFHRALMTTKTLLRLHIQRRGECYAELSGYGTIPKKNPIISKLISTEVPVKPRLHIGMPEDFRRVSAIIDVDIVPETHRRVKLMKNGSDKPLGFYIRDGTSVRVTSHGLEKVPAIFISRLVPGGLAESTGLLAVNDEVLEVNGIEVTGKSLDQVTDMMVANSSNLIITVKPKNQRLTLAPVRGGVGRGSQASQASTSSLQSYKSAGTISSDVVVEHDEESEMKDDDSCTGEKTEDDIDEIIELTLPDDVAQKVKAHDSDKTRESDRLRSSDRARGSDRVRVGSDRVRGSDRVKLTDKTRESDRSQRSDRSRHDKTHVADKTRDMGNSEDRSHTKVEDKSNEADGTEYPLITL